MGEGRLPLKLRLVVTSTIDDARYSIPALRFDVAQVRLLEFGKVLRCNEHEKPEQDHCRNVRARAGAISDSGAIPFELREVEHAQDIVGPRIVDRIAAGS